MIEKARRFIDIPSGFSTCNGYLYVKKALETGFLFSI
jgi:hypothetical protein